MVYGRRFSEKKNGPVGDKAPLRAPTSRIHRRAFQSFQSKYLTYMTLALGGSLLVFALPVWYLIQQNYQIFQSLAFDTAPELIAHLDQERIWLFGVLLLSFVSVLVIGVWTSLRITDSVIGPLMAIEKHMREVSLGNWKSEDFHIRKSDEFRSLSNSYSYLYRTLKAQTQQEIDLLEKIMVDPSNRDSYQAWRYLIETKKQLLGVEPNSSYSAEEISSSQEQRRAS